VELEGFFFLSEWLICSKIPSQTQGFGSPSAIWMEAAVFHASNAAIQKAEHLLN